VAELPPNPFDVVTSSVTSVNPAQYLQAWVVGETLQGRIMLIAGILLSIGAVLIFKSANPLLRGALIPLILLVAMNLGYGAVLVARPTTSHSRADAYQIEPHQAMERELRKARRDEKYYASARPAWVVLTALSVMLFFVFKDNYFRGLSLGLTAMFFGALLIDSFLHVRLLVYIEALQHLPGGST
jgi:hypothetical protein